MSGPETKIDLLAFAPHPDDAEIWCAGLLIKMAELGKRTAIIDLSEGELSSQGTPETRKAETAAATEVLGLSHRDNLQIADGAIGLDLEQQVPLVVQKLRELQPSVVLAPYWEERHPDHIGASKLIKRAVFFSGVKNFQPSLGQAYSPTQLVYYRMRKEFSPSFICDISAVHAKKMGAIRCFKSQVERSDESAATLVSSPLSLSSVEARDGYFGAMIGTKYGEPYLVENALRIDNPVKYFNDFPGREALVFPKD